MIDLLHVNRALEMLIQLRLSAKFAMTNIALVEVSIEGVARGPWFAPFKQIVGDQAVGITPTESLVDGRSVDARSFTTRSCLEMVC